MYRFVLLACLVGFAQSACHLKTPVLTQGNGQSGNIGLSSFESSAFDIAQDVITADRQIQSFCESYANVDIKETYGKDYYQLIVNLPNFTEDNIVVKIMNRILFVSAEDCSRSYADVKMLPDVVDRTRAVWKYWQGQLVVFIPYKVVSAQVQRKNCGGPIVESVLLVPQQTTGNCVAACSRPSSRPYAGDGIIRDNVWHPSGASGGFGSSGLGLGASAGGFGQSALAQGGFGQSALAQGGFGQGAFGGSIQGGFGRGAGFGNNGGVTYNGVFGSRNG